jgi:hypothetical protein
VIRVEERHITLAKDDRGRLNARASVRPRRKWCLMAEDDHVYVPLAVQTFELSLYPLELLFIASDVGIEGDHECVAITERVCGIAGHAARRAIGRNKPRDGVEIVSQGRLAFGRVGSGGTGDVVIARREKIRDATFGGETIDERHEAGVPLMRVDAALHRVARSPENMHRPHKACIQQS